MNLQGSNAVKLEDVDRRETVNKPVLKPRPEHSASHARNPHENPGHQAPQSTYSAAPAMAAQQQLIQPPAIYQVLLAVRTTILNEGWFKEESFTTCFNGSFLPVDMRDVLQKTPFRNERKRRAKCP